MAIWLKQSTASQEVCLGPFVDSTDGKTAETGLTIANTDIVLWKMGGTTTGTKNSGGGTHMAGGLYSAVLDATDTGTLGGLVALVNVAGALPVRHEFQVLPANIYDSVIAGTDTLNADVTLWLGTAAATPTVAGVPEVDITHFNGTAGTFAAGRPEVNTTHAAGTAWNSGAIGASTLASDTLTAAKVAADVSTEFATTLLGTAVPGAFGAGTLGRVAGRSLPDVTAGGAGGLFIAGTNAATTITTGLTTTFTGNLTGSVGSVTGAVGSVTGAVGSVTGAVGSVTGNVGGNVTGTVGAAASVTGNVGGNVTGSVGSVTGLTASNLDTTVSSRLAPTVAARTLDVSATGEAGVDWANVGTPGSTVALSATTVGTVTTTATATNVTTVNGLSAGTIDSILDDPIEGSMTLRQAMRIVLAACANKLSGAATTTVTIRDLADTKARITATVDADGNRSAVTLDAT